MLARLNQELTRLQELRLRREKLARRAEALRREESELAARVESLAHTLRRVERDVQRLEGLTLTALFHAVLGSKEVQLEKERQETLAARLKHDEAAHRLAAIRQERARAEEQLAREPEVTAEYERLLAEKERLITAQDAAGAAELFRLGERSAQLAEEVRELEEARSAGETAAAELARVVEALESAHNWGVWDMVGGGFIATAVKHSRIDKARDHVHRAQAALARFNRELQDVRAAVGVSVDLNGLTRFADFFFDGLIMDWVVQSRINESLRQARSGAAAVAGMLDRLARRLEAARAEQEEVGAARRAYLERFGAGG